MKPILKKLLDLFKIKDPVISIPEQTRYNQSLIDRINRLLLKKELDLVKNNPIAEIYVLSTYSKSLHDLGMLLNIPSPNRQLVAINLYSYLKGEKSNVSSVFSRLTIHMATNRCTSQSLHDIEEIVGSLENILGMNNE